MTGLRAAAAAAVAVALVATACGEGGGPAGRAAGGGTDGPALSLRHTEPLRSGAPVRWTLVVANGGGAAVDLVFPSGRDGDVVLRQGGAERYRWSAERFFTQGVRTVRVEAGAGATFVLDDGPLRVPPGTYELVASLAARPRLAEVTRQVTVAG